MGSRIRSIQAAALVAGLICALAAAPASAITDPAILGCRAAVGKNATSYVKTALKAMTGCHKSRDKDGTLSGTDCNDISATSSASKVTDAATKFSDKVVGKCTGVTPSNARYNGCPYPCFSATAADFTDVASCLSCLTNAQTELYSDEANGTPTSPLTNEADADCHSAVTKNGSKLFNSAVKSATKCQADYDTRDDFSLCTDTGFADLTQKAYDKCVSGISDKCAAATLPGTTLDPCGSAATAADLATCVCNAARNDAQQISAQIVDLTGPFVATTTTSTTLTTLPVGNALCPDIGEITLYSHDSQIPCTSNTDCAEPRFCNTDIGYCVSQANLDSGWNGVGHRSDINDGVVTRAHLYCPDATPTCGQCDVVGIEPSPGNCRCANNSRTICDQPFNKSATDCPACVGGSSVRGRSCADNSDCSFPTCAARCSQDLSLTCVNNADCTGHGTCSTSGSDPHKKCSNGLFCNSNPDCVGTCEGVSMCECFFGAPFPLNSGGTPACVVNRFAEDITGTANVDLGSGDITANLRTRVYLGITDKKPCPVCDGKCSNNNAVCVRDADCGSGNTCIQDVPDDGIRNGICSGGVNTGQSCDANGSNATFPAVGPPPVIPAGGQYSLDCMPSVGLNVSGTGLEISLDQSTGTKSLGAALDCDASGPGTDLCPCLVCSKDESKPCKADAECTGQGSFCSGYTDPVKFECTSDPDCASLDLGVCQQNLTCSNGSAKACTTNADCTAQAGGSCIVSTCSSNGGSDFPKPNKCDGGACSDTGDGITGSCTTGPDQMYCDGLLRIDGRGMKTCLSNTDCTSPSPNGSCTLSERLPCFLDPIVAQGSPDPTYPLGAAVFCLPPTVNPGINSAVGLPGPGRVLSQGKAREFCANNHNNLYVPGVGCPP